MIDKSQAFSDAPPPYQHALRSSSDSKVNLAPPTSDSPSASRSSSRTTLSKRHPNARTKGTVAPSRWLPTSIFGLSKTAKQVRSATQGFLRDLLSQARPCEHEWISLLEHCADTCNAHGLNFSSLLQEPFVEGHLPVYWAILKRPVSPAPVKTDHDSATPSGDPDALVLAILNASIPLTPQCVADARLACMTVSDNALFVRLGRRYDAFSPRSGTDRVLLGGTDAVDAVAVVETRAAAASAAFVVRFSIAQFQLRMRVSKLARIEFIARGTYEALSQLLGSRAIANKLFLGSLVLICSGRLWYLTFSVASVSNGSHLCVARAGEWLVSLGLGEYSSPTWVDARLSIVDHHAIPSTPAGTDTSYRMALRGLPLPPKHPLQGLPGKSRPAMSLPIRTSNFQISPGGPMREVVVSLEKFMAGVTLQNE
jgi:hypothetical protein